MLAHIEMFDLLYVPIVEESFTFDYIVLRSSDQRTLTESTAP